MMRRTTARKRFGQHFLEPSWIAKVVGAIAPAPSDLVLEIGPGRGALTEPLASRVERVVAVELDRDLVAGLNGRQIPRVVVVSADVLDADLSDLAELEAQVAGSSREIVVPNDITKGYDEQPSLVRAAEVRDDMTLGELKRMSQDERDTAALAV